MKKLLLITFYLSISVITTALTVDSLNVAGNVSNILNGAPVVNKTVMIDIDSSSNWGATIGQSTDSSGNYALRIPVLGPSGYIRIRLLDCNNILQSVTRYYNLGGAPDSIVQNFSICDSTDPHCHSYYNYTTDLYNPGTIHFHNLSSFLVSSWHWDFGDGQNEIIYYPGSPDVTHNYYLPGFYNVCLTIHGMDSLCVDTYCSIVHIDSVPYPCTAQFTEEQDSSNNYSTYIFQDYSSGNITHWAWDFGDGQHSSQRNPVHTYQQSGTYIVQLVVGSADSACYSQDYDTLYVETGTGCQAIFVFYSNGPSSDHIVHFIDGSTGNPTSWLWNFDDPDSGPGNVSYLQDADHVFASPGNHHVCLTISGDSCSSTYCHDVMIPDSVQYHQVYGQVFEGNFPFRWAHLTLMSQHNGENIVPYMDDCSTDSNGVYIFNQVPDGRYVIFADDYNEQNKYLRTWYRDTFMWDQATEIVLGEPTNPYNFHLVPLGSPVPGPGLISGQINSETIPNQILANINMILMDSNLKPISLSPVSAVGQFVFPSLDYGTYYLHPEEMGFYGDIVKVEISSSNPHGEIVMTLTGHQILGTENLQSVTETVLIYPNPVTDQLTISINLKASGKISIDVFTINGQLVFTTSENANSGLSRTTLPFSGLNEGMYIVKIHSEEGFNVVRRVIKSR